MKIGHFVNSAWSRRDRITYRCSCVAGDRRRWLIEEELPMAKTGAAQTTVTLKHLAAALAETHEMAKKQSELILNDLVDLVTKHLKKGDRIRLVGLGILQV